MMIGTGPANATYPGQIFGGQSPAGPGSPSSDNFPDSVVGPIVSVPVLPAGGGAASAAGTSGGATCQPENLLGSYTLTDNACTRGEKFGDLSRLLTVIRKDKRLRQYSKVSRDFVNYLRLMDSMGLCVSGWNNRDNKGINKLFIANHRWTTGYRKKLLAKLYLLDQYIQENPSAITLLTLTVYQDGEYSEQVTGKKLTIPESFELLKKSWKKLSMMLRAILPGTEYIWIVEPHKTGYPHLHVVLFTDVTIGMQERIKTLWSEKYHAGSFENGADFEIRRPDQAIESLRNYLMKYIAKGFISTDSRYGGDGWTASELVFNACVWNGGYRTFQPSKGLQKTMGWTPGKDDAIYWFENKGSFDGHADSEFIIWEKSLVGWIPGRVLADLVAGPVGLPSWKIHNCRDCWMFPNCEGCT